MYFNRNSAAECVAQQVVGHYHEIVEAIERWRENRIAMKGRHDPGVIKIPIWLKFEDPGFPVAEPEKSHLVNKNRHQDGTVCYNLWCKSCAAKSLENRTEAQADLGATRNYRLRQLSGTVSVEDFYRHEDDQTLCLEPQNCLRCTVAHFNKVFQIRDELRAELGDDADSEDSL